MKKFCLCRFLVRLLPIASWGLDLYSTVMIFTAKKNTFKNIAYSASHSHSDKLWFAGVESVIYKYGRINVPNIVVVMSK